MTLRRHRYRRRFRFSQAYWLPWASWDGGEESGNLALRAHLADSSS